MTYKIKTVLAATLFSLSSLATAADSHYVPGIEGVKASSAPPPGVYYKGYYVNYDADKLDQGPPGKNKVKVNALAHRFIWVTPQQALGGDLIFEAILPMVDTELSLANGAVKDSQKGFGDLFIGSVIGWHGQNWDAVAGVGYWATTGKYKSTQPASPGKKDSSFMFTYGGTLKLTEEGDVTLSALGRYETATAKTEGDEVILEYGLGKSINALDLGLVGYSTFETSKNKEKRNALGASVGYFWPSVMLGSELAFYKEFNNTRTFEGRVIRLSLTKVF